MPTWECRPVKRKCPIKVELDIERGDRRILRGVLASGSTSQHRHYSWPPRSLGRAETHDMPAANRQRQAGNFKDAAAIQHVSFGRGVWLPPVRQVQHTTKALRIATDEKIAGTVRRKPLAQKEKSQNFNPKTYAVNDTQMLHLMTTTRAAGKCFSSQARWP